jgi:hypothetical protein
MQQFSGNAAQTQPSWRSTHPPGETEKETIAPLPHSVNPFALSNLLFLKEID